MYIYDGITFPPFRSPAELTARDIQREIETERHWVESIESKDDDNEG